MRGNALRAVRGVPDVRASKAGPTRAGGFVAVRDPGRLLPESKERLHFPLV